MGIIRIDWDDGKVAEEEIVLLSEAFRTIVADAIGSDDVFVYANSSDVKVKVDPIEIFVELTAGKIEDEDELIGSFKSRLADWKKQNGFEHPINLTLIPMHWKFAIGI